MSASDEVYAKALQYRDNKVPGFSAEQALAEAEKLFLELGEQGHCKAMHNYAVLQQKKGKYKLALECYSQAGLDASRANIKAMKECGQIKEGLFLVVANDRSMAGNFGSPIMDVVYGTDFDMSHLRSFGGNATTCDTNPCEIPEAKHIIADVLTFDFTKKYNLKHVLTISYCECQCWLRGWACQRRYARCERHRAPGEVQLLWLRGAESRQGDGTRRHSGD